MILLLIALAYGAWAGYHFYTYKRTNGVPPPPKSYIPFVRSGPSSTNYPSPRSANPIEWIKDQFNKIRNKRTHQGAYEESGGQEQQYGVISGTNTARRGRGLEDDAWDTRVGNEDPYGASGPGGYNEEQELGLAPTPGYGNDHSNPYGRTDYMNQSTSYGGGHERGRVAQLATTEYERERPRTLDDPFEDRHEAASLRSVSPRPEGDGRGHKRDNSSLHSITSSPTSIRKSHFREEDMR